MLSALLNRLINAYFLAAEEAADVDGTRVVLTRGRLALIMFSATAATHGDIHNFRKVTLAISLLFLLVERLHCRDLLGCLSLDLTVHLIRRMWAIWKLLQMVLDIGGGLHCISMRQVSRIGIVTTPELAAKTFVLLSCMLAASFSQSLRNIGIGATCCVGFRAGQCREVDLRRKSALLRI